MKKGTRVEFVGWHESDVLMTGTIEKIRDAQTGKNYLISCDLGGNYEVPERFILRTLD